MQSFQHSQFSSRSSSVLWQVYTDVTNWKNWDTELESSSLDGVFAEGATGKLKSKNSPESKFKLTNVQVNSRFDTEVEIPFGKLIIEHLLEEQGGGCKFTHKVYFTGILAPVFGLILGRGFQKALPEVLKNLKQISESGSL